MTVNFANKISYLLIITLLLTSGTTGYAQNNTEEIKAQIAAQLDVAKQNLNSGQYNPALQKAQAALEKANTIQNNQLAWEANNLIGEVYLTKNNFQKAISIFLDMAIHAEKSNNYSVSANAYLSLANIYSHMGAFDRANNTYNLAYDQFNQIDYEMGLIEVKSASSFNYLTAKKYDKALEDFTKLLKLAEKDSLGYFQLIALDGLLQVNQKAGNYEAGIVVGQDYLKLIALEGGSEQMAINARNQLASIYLLQEENELALEELNTAEDIAGSKIINNAGLAHTYDLLSQVYAAMGNQNQSATYTERFNTLQNQLPEKNVYHPDDQEDAELLAQELERAARSLIAQQDSGTKQIEDEKREQILSEEKARLKKFEDESLVGNRTFGHSALEAEYIHQDLMVSQHEYESTERQTEILRYKDELVRHKLELELAREEKVILEQEAEIAAQQKLVYQIIGGAILIITILLGVEYMRIRRMNRLLAGQKTTIHNRNVELEMSNTTITQQNTRLRTAHDQIRKSHDDLKKAQVKLIESEKMSALGMLTAGIAHELNNPISFVSNGLEILGENIEEAFDSLTTFEQLLQLNDLDEIKTNYELYKSENANVEVLKKDTADLLNDTKFGSVRIIEIVDGLRIFSRKDEKKFKKSSLPEIVDSALLITKSKYKGRVQIIKEYGDKLPHIDCFPGQLNQIFINLIGNACDAIEGDGWVKIIMQNLTGKHVRVIVQDSGTGMPESVRLKIFEALFTTKEAGKGTGLGLSITNDIVKLHKGHIEVRSKEGVGTAFILTFQVDLMKKQAEV